MNIVRTLLQCFQAVRKWLVIFRSHFLKLPLTKRWKILEITVEKRRKVGLSREYSQTLLAGVGITTFTLTLHKINI